MSLVNMKEMLSAARKAKKAVGAFNVTNYETAAAVLKAAEAENEPVIIQLYMRLFDTGKAYDLAGTLQRLAYRGKVPVALHLDTARRSSRRPMPWHGAILPSCTTVRVRHTTRT